jgi:hypothetical protein
MARIKDLGLYVLAAIVVAAIPSVRPAAGQGLQNVLHAQARVFPEVGPGVKMLKRDSSSRYYVLADPANSVIVYDATGKRIGQIPNANSHGATIHYAVDIDVDRQDRLFVVDRGANAIKIFATDGSLLATIPVTAPTSVVALSDGQFAVTTLLSKRLVQIMDEKGAVIRTFGDPADQTGAQPQNQPETPTRTPAPIVDRGRIVGDPQGNIYFAFATLADPTFQRFDRFGYSAYQAVVSADAFGSQNEKGDHRIELGYTMSGYNWPTGVSAWTDLHSLTSLSVARGMRRGLRGQAAESDSSGSLSSQQGDSLDFSAIAGPDALEDPTGLDAAETADLGTGFMTPGMFGMGAGGAFGMRGGEFHGGMPGGGFGEGAGRSELSGFSGRPGAGGEGFGFHGHPGFDTYRATATVRVILDNPSGGVREKPVITAVGVDPDSQEAWAAIGDMLVHFDPAGNTIQMYYLMLTDGQPLKPASILVEPNRLLIAADPWGVYEFSRPDKSTQSASPQSSAAPQHAIVPRQIPPTPQPSVSTQQ